MAKQGLNITTAEKIGFRPIADSEPEWLYRMRLDAWNYFQESGLPDRASHLWRYTDPAGFEIDGLKEIVNNLLYDRTNKTGRTDGKSGADDVIITDLDSAVREYPELISNHLGTLAGVGTGRYEALNAALWGEGSFLYVPDNTTLEEPIYIRNFMSDKFSIYRNLMIIGDNSRVTIVDDYQSGAGNDRGYANCVIEMGAGKGANITYVNLYRPYENVRGITSFRSRIGRDSSLHTLFGGFGGSVSKVFAGVELAGRGANSRMDGIVFAKDKQRFDYHTRQHHSASESFSNIDFKIILKEKSTSAYTGLIRIEKDALNCEAYQENRNLLLNPGARAQSIPELEILTDQVVCTHGATMGPIDPEMIFYLRSRGFDQIEATKAIVDGFVASILKNIPDSVAGSIRNIVADKLGGRSDE